MSPTSDFLSPRLLGVEAGIEAPDEGRSWQAEDTVVYGITMRSPGRWKRWLVRIVVRAHPAEVDPAEASAAGRQQATVLLGVETLGNDGASQPTRTVAVPADDLDHGLYPGCLVALAVHGTERTEGNRLIIAGPGLTDEERATVDRSLATLTALFDLASAELKPIVDTVVARPSLAEILLHGGVVQLTISAGIFGGTEIVGAMPDVQGTVCSFPFEVRAYDRPALCGRLFVTDSRPPFLPGGGIVAVEAAHPDRPYNTVSVRLLAAWHGARNVGHR